MNEVLIDVKVNINEFPEVDTVHAVTSESEITIGDLHANAVKLMHFLVRQGVLRITKENYEKIVKIYQILPHELIQQDINEFNRIISTAEVVSKPTVRLIGDELADRGSNDYFVLKIIENLRNNDVPVRILLSNHGCEFYNKYEDALKNPAKYSEVMSKLKISNQIIILHNISIIRLANENPGPSDEYMPFDPMDRGQTISLNNMAILLYSKFISREEIVELVEKFYKPSLFSIDYTLSEDKKEIVIHSHAPIGLQTIKALAEHEKINVGYNDASAEALALTIDSINRKFQAYLGVGGLSDLYRNQTKTASEISADNPFEFITWNRKYFKLLRPHAHNGYKIRYTHGHDSFDPGTPLDGIYNLDGDLGKTPVLNEGTYKVFYSCKAAVLRKIVSPAVVSLLTVQGLVKRELKKSGNPPTELWHLTFKSAESIKKFIEQYCKPEEILWFSKKESRTTNCYSYPYRGAERDPKNVELRLDSIAYGKIFGHLSMASTETAQPKLAQSSANLFQPEPRKTFLRNILGITEAKRSTSEMIHVIFKDKDSYSFFCHMKIPHDTAVGNLALIEYTYFHDKFIYDYDKSEIDSIVAKAKDAQKIIDDGEEANGTSNKDKLWFGVVKSFIAIVNQPLSHDDLYHKLHGLFENLSTSSFIASPAEKFMVDLQKLLPKQNVNSMQMRP